MPDKKEKISLEEVKKIPVQHLMKMIDRAKKYLKKDEVMQRIFDEYDVSIDELDLIPMCFSDIEVSGKTDHAVIYLNYRLLCDGDFYKDFSYLIHEVGHYLQQTTGSSPTQGADDGDYLENPYEVEAFKNQVEFIAKEHGEDEAETYVDDLLEHHDIDDKKEKEEKKDELMALV